MARTVADVDPGEVINITRPAADAVINAQRDLDPATPTCEIDLQATLAGRTIAIGEVDQGWTVGS